MSTAPYSRVYWTIPDDPKFVGVYDDDRALACWLRLLLVADQAWPSSAHLPRSARSGTVSKLEQCGLIDLLPGDRFRIHGLDAERQRRADHAQRASRARWNAPSIPASNPKTILDETRRDETSLDEDEEYVVAYFNATGRAPSALQRQKLWELYDRHSIGWLVDNLVGDDPLGHAFDADTAWRRAEADRVKAEEAAHRREKERQRKRDHAALVRLTTHPEDAA